MVSLDASAEVIIPEAIKRDRRVERMPATLGVGLPVVVGIVVWLCVIRLCCVGGGRQTILDNEKSLSAGCPFFRFRRGWGGSRQEEQ